jgi:VanZ family protein
LALIAGWSFNITRNRMRPVYYLLAGVFMWGVLMEILQRTMHNGRNFDFRDMVANLTGAIIGFYVFRYLDRMREKLLLQKE